MWEGKQNYLKEWPYNKVHCSQDTVFVSKTEEHVLGAKTKRLQSEKQTTHQQRSQHPGSSRVAARLQRTTYTSPSRVPAKKRRQETGVPHICQNRRNRQWTVMCLKICGGWNKPDLKRRPTPKLLMAPEGKERSVCPKSVIVSQEELWRYRWLNHWCSSSVLCTSDLGQATWTCTGCFSPVCEQESVKT